MLPEMLFVSKHIADKLTADVLKAVTYPPSLTIRTVVPWSKE